MKYRILSRIILFCILGWLNACGQPELSSSGTKPPTVVETLQPNGDVNGVIMHNVYPEPQNGSIHQYSVTIGPEQAVVTSPEPTPTGPDYIQSKDTVTILGDHYWRRYTGDVIPVTRDQHIVLQQSAYPEQYDIQPIYNPDELELIQAHPETATWMFKPKKAGTILLKMRKRFICGSCQNMPLTTISIELNVSP